MDTLLASITDLTVRIDRFQYCIAAAVATLLQPERAVPRTGESSLLLSDVYDSEAQQISLFLDLLLYLSLSFFFHGRRDLCSAAAAAAATFSRMARRETTAFLLTLSFPEHDSKHPASAPSRNTTANRRK